jgi:hypothetical protein
VFLMLTGVATLGIISGTLASFFRSKPAKEDPSAPSATNNEVVTELTAVREQLTTLEARLRQPD